eukprot:m.240059 g.240059  ORF g.240059 m.240059 type:complete len:108 (-) comp14453_c0_seq1:89-412(-)
MSDNKRKPRENILDLSQYVNKQLRVKFSGGREVVGKLLGYDALTNIVLDETIEYLRDPEDLSKITDNTRELGLCVCRSTAITLLCPEAGHECIANPFALDDDEEDAQ